MKSLLIAAGLMMLAVGMSAQTRDSSQIRRKAFESSFFFSSDTVSRNDYLLKIGNVLQLLNQISVMVPPDGSVEQINNRLTEDKSVLNIIEDRVTNNDRALRVRNLQMYDILLSQIRESTVAFAAQLTGYDSILDGYKAKVAAVVKDTVLRHVFRDSALRASFQSQLDGVREKWKAADSTLRHYHTLINNTLANTSDNLILISDLQSQVENLNATVGARAFGKERRYLWSQRVVRSNPARARRFQSNIASEKKITQYYFQHTHYQANLLLVTGLIFFFWVFFNFKILKKKNQLPAVEPFHFRIIKELPFFATILFILNLAPLFDLDAPAVYIEFIELLLMITLTFAFARRLPKKVFYLWLIFILLFLFSFFSYLRLPFYLNRWLSIILNAASFMVGVYTFITLRRTYQQRRIMASVVMLYIIFNFLAVVCNLFGRVTLTQVLSSTAIFMLIQTAALLVFVRAVTEAILLQIQRSRIAKGFSAAFDFNGIERGTRKIVVFCAVVIWLVVFSTNLNLYNALSGKVTDLLTTPRKIGSFSFTLGSLLLFLVIMWVANFLQKYIGYFFGDVGDEVNMDNKTHRSRLLITRLLLLIGGFLLAVAASGLPVDRITVILGALGVGIGLGLQGIVNNFVSGIILIFDRTLRIGDTVQIGDKKGRVKEISVRSSTLLTDDGAEVIIPNGDVLSHNIVNWTLSSNSTRLELDFSINKTVPVSDIKAWVAEIAQKIDPADVNKTPDVFIRGLTSQSMMLKMYFWCNDIRNTDQLQSDIFDLLHKKFADEGIKMI